MHQILNLYKPSGRTPLQVIEAYKAKHANFKDIRMTYAGRLDPMAEGVLPVLAGDAVMKKEDFMTLDKEYEAEILLGISTDSYDPLGFVTSTQDKVPNTGIADELSRFTGSNLLESPPYSSTVVEGKPLFYWAREGKLNQIDIPKRTMTVHEIELLGVEERPKEMILQDVIERVSRVDGDFRQEETKKLWELSMNEFYSTLTVVKVKFHVESGTYIRAIAHELGKRLGCGAILLKLKRTQVGEMNINDSQRL